LSGGKAAGCAMRNAPPVNISMKPGESAARSESLVSIERIEIPEFDETAPIWIEVLDMRSGRVPIAWVQALVSEEIGDQIAEFIIELLKDYIPIPDIGVCTIQYTDVEGDCAICNRPVADHERMS